MNVKWRKIDQQNFLPQTFLLPLIPHVVNHSPCRIHPFVSIAMPGCALGNSQIHTVLKTLSYHGKHGIEKDGSMLMLVSDRMM